MALLFVYGTNRDKFVTVAECWPFNLVNVIRVLDEMSPWKRIPLLYKASCIPGRWLTLQSDVSWQLFVWWKNFSTIHATHSDHHEREGYTVGLQARNLENEFHAAQDAAFNVDDNDPFITGSVYTDVNGERRDPSGPMIDALLGMVADRSNPTDQPTRLQLLTVPTEGILPLLYRMQGPTVLVNQWEDPCYFTGAFPTLFPNGTGGHLGNREIPVSLDTYAEWALKHHSRR